MNKEIGSRIEYDSATDTVGFLDEYGSCFYWFSFDRIITHADYNFWFEHLSRKRWFTPQAKYALIDVLERLGQSGNPEGADLSVSREQSRVVDYDNLPF